MFRNHFRALAAAASLTALLGAGLAAPGGPASAVPSSASVPATARSAAPSASRWTPRPEQYPGTVRTTDVPIEMDDGVVLRGDLTLPAMADGSAVDRPVPVIVMITAYNKTVIAGGGGGLAGGDPDYLIKRGYAYLVVDARGTGSSAGTWEAFSARENKDAGKIVAWAHRQPWSNGKVGMVGPSYMGISQLMAAGHHPPGLKAIFPQVPGIDVYRDIVASGGQIDVGFIPLWLGLVHATGLIPPAYAADDPSALGTLLEHLMGGGTFTLPLVLDALAGGDSAYDGPFYRERSVGTYLDDVTVPTFLVGGEYDLFQRGTPMIYEKLERNGAPVRMIIGPWDHLQASAGADIVDAGYGPLAELQLRWFDHWIKGRNTALGEIAPITYYEQGSDRWRTAGDWVDPTAGVHTRRLSGTSMQGGKVGGLVPKRGAAGASTMLPLPVSGLCTRSTNQWTAGVLNMIWADNPCFTDNDINDYTGLTFQTETLEHAVHFRGADQRPPLRLGHRRRRDAVGGGRRRRARWHRPPDHWWLAGHLPAQAGQGEVALRRRQADPAVAPVHQGRQGPARVRGDRTGRRRDLPDRGGDPARPPAAAHDPGFRRPPPARHAPRHPHEPAADHALQRP